MRQIEPMLNMDLRARNPCFEGQYDRVHIDEKWFWLSKDGEKYLLVLGEERPVRRVRHKKYMTKVMFLCAQARPRYDPHTERWWDGKIGIWPVGKYCTTQVFCLLFLEYRSKSHMVLVPHTRAKELVHKLHAI